MSRKPNQFLPRNWIKKNLNSFFPLEDYYKIALAVLKLSPADFRSMTPVEFDLAYDGYLEVNGLKKHGMSWGEVESLMDKHGIADTSPSIKKRKKHGQDCS